MTWEICEGDALTPLREMESGSVQCCITSPPYFGLRDYGNEAQIGLEATTDEYVAKLVEVFGEVKRVLRDDGTLWLNLGDSYADGARDAERWPKQSRNNNGDRIEHAKKHTGCKTKDLLGIPWMVAFALRADGWYLRSEIIWAKPNPMPESVTDRPTKAHEQVFLLSKSARYFYDSEAIGEAAIHAGDTVTLGSKSLSRAQGDAMPGRYASGNGIAESLTVAARRNKRSVWTVATKPYPEAHFATFPPKLIEPMVLAGCPRGDVVLDPFAGSGTTLQVAIAHGRSAIGIELNPEYAQLARNRLAGVTPSMFDLEPAA